MKDWQNESSGKEYTMQVTPHIILFLDILGYSETIIKSKPPKDENYYLEEVHYIMSTLSSFIEERNRYVDNNNDDLGLSRFKSLIFSDNILFFAPYDNDIDRGNLYMNLLYGLAAFLFQYQKEDFFFRGGITAGPLYYDEKLHMVYGSGLVRAYELESKSAIYPRIVIDENLKPVDWLVGLRKENGEGIWYFDYLELAYALYKQEEMNKDLHHSDKLWLENHQSYIQNALIKHKDNLKIYEKYKWLAEYYNQFCDKHQLSNFMVEL